MGDRDMWDVFISHASEDNASVATPLAGELQNYCLRVWLDTQAISLSDSLRHKIDEGIFKSMLGVVVLSPPFFAKKWPQYELKSLYTQAVSGKCSVVLVLHEITANEVTVYSPPLDDLLALSTGIGIENISEKIARKLNCNGLPLTVEVGAGPLSVALGVPDWLRQSARARTFREATLSGELWCPQN